MRLLKNLLGSEVENIFIKPSFRCDYGYDIHLGENYNCTISDCAKVRIGEDVLIGSNVNIFTVGHSCKVIKAIEE
ncbi:hypothetical protein UT300005_13100 [Clostridium sp. CTA-5]